MLLAFGISAGARGAAAQAPAAAMTDPHWHDFDFEFGPTWNAELRLLAKRLAGSHLWIHYHGTLKSHPLWGGKGNISELDVSSGTSRIDGGALHLYNPDAREWSVWFANLATGTLGVPSVGVFSTGRGVLYDHEPYHGKMVYVRQIFSNISAHTFDFHQAFSPDNGKTWETNLIINYTR
jgi:hypothetical protein